MGKVTLIIENPRIPGGSLTTTVDVGDDVFPRFQGAYGKAYGKMKVDPDDPKSDERWMTPAEVLNRWLVQTLNGAGAWVRAYESDAAAEVARAAVPEVKIGD